MTTYVLTAPYFICKLIRQGLVQTESSQDWRQGGVNLKFQFNTTLYTFHGVPRNGILSLLEVLAPFIKQWHTIQRKSSNTKKKTFGNPSDKYTSVQPVVLSQQKNIPDWWCAKNWTIRGPTQLRASPDCPTSTDMPLGFNNDLQNGHSKAPGPFQAGIYTTYPSMALYGTCCPVSQTKDVKKFINPSLFISLTFCSPSKLLLITHSEATPGIQIKGKAQTETFWLPELFLQLLGNLGGGEDQVISKGTLGLWR